MKTLILLFLSFGLSAQISLFEQRGEHLILTDKVEQIHNEQPETLELAIGEEILQLHKAEVFTDSYHIRTSEGEVYPRNKKMLFYRGDMLGLESIAVVSFINDEVHIMFSSKKGDFRIYPINNEYRFFQDTLTPVFTCFVNDELVNTQDPPQQLFQIGNCVEVYFECDFKSYQNNGSSVTNTEAWVAALFNEVSTLYENEGIPIMISDIMVWTTTDPYASINSTGGVLNAFVNHSNQNGYDGRLGHLLSTRSLGGGIAYVNVLCHTTLPYAFSASLSTNIVPYPDYSWNVTVVAHEMGHNFGSHHTHNCVWNGNNTQIDDCGSEFGDEQPCYDEGDPILPNNGTIMSYCHLIPGIGINFNLGFGDQPGALILNKYNTALCNTGNCLVLAIGVEKFELRTDDCIVYLRWIADFPVLFESDNGIEWQEISVNGDNHKDYTPSKYYKLESEGDAQSLVNYELCTPDYQVLGSTILINTEGNYQISSIDGKIIVDRYLSEGTTINLTTGIWLIRHINSEIIIIQN